MSRMKDRRRDSCSLGQRKQMEGVCRSLYVFSISFTHSQTGAIQHTVHGRSLRRLGQANDVDGTPTQ